jgi:hypothetical protein
MNPDQPVFLDSSKEWCKILGLKSINGDLRRSLENQMCASEVQRCMHAILPKLIKLDQGEMCSDELEFMTECGRQSFTCTWYKTRSIIIGTVAVPDTL